MSSDDPTMDERQGDDGTAVIEFVGVTLLLLLPLLYLLLAVFSVQRAAFGVTQAAFTRECDTLPSCHGPAGPCSGRAARDLFAPLPHEFTLRESHAPPRHALHRPMGRSPA